MTQFNHIASSLNEKKKVVFTAQSCKNFHLRMLICKHAFQMWVVPVNPFMVFGYYLYELVERNQVRNGNNNLIQRCDELRVYWDISDWVLAEIIMCKEIWMPIRYFDISWLPSNVVEIEKEQCKFEDWLENIKL